MKKSILLYIVVICLLTFCCLFAFVGCSDKGEDGEFSVVCTIFPEYDWVKNVVGEDSGVNISLLQDSGVDLHSYQPSAKDIILISSCDLFIYVGGESDEWVDSALKQNLNKNRMEINLFDVLGDAVKDEEIVEGMESEEEEEGEEGESESDEHVWLSLSNAKVIISCIAEKMGQIDEANGEKYARNAEAYCEQLTALDQEYRNATESAAFDTLVFGDRFPFRYLADDYGLRYYAAFAGCSAESEAAFETIIFLAEKVDELGLTHVIKIEGSNNRIAETVIENTTKKDQTVLTLHSLQSITAADIEKGADYLSIMRNNLEILKQALN